MKAMFDLHTTKDKIAYWTCNSFAVTGLVKHGFSTRNGGVSDGCYHSLNLGVNTPDKRENVVQNFELFCKPIGIDYQKLVLSNQVHDNILHIVTEQDMGKGLMKQSDIVGVDGLITNIPGIPIATFYADCTPILLLDPVKKVIATVHSGWKGTLKQIGSKAVRMLKEKFDSNAEDILVAIGPNIKPCHFEVSKDVYDMFCDTFGEITRKHTVIKGEKYYIDTNAINVSKLLEEGVLPANISICDVCTYCSNDTYYSHRADGGKTGRMCAVIELN